MWKLEIEILMRSLNETGLFLGVSHDCTSKTNLHGLISVEEPKLHWYEEPLCWLLNKIRGETTLLERKPDVTKSLRPLRDKPLAENGVKITRLRVHLTTNTFELYIVICYESYGSLNLHCILAGVPIWPTFMMWQTQATFCYFLKYCFADHAKSVWRTQNSMIRPKR